ncbi:MAG: tripartite tricarboxylate transporter substrate binding protein [Angelakisella sp.]|nr:tripartite tricarboxylate transporter substrate binding protein [Angelakisella sp.]
MKRLLCIALSVLLCAALLAGCTTPNTPLSTSGEPSAPAAPNTSASETTFPTKEITIVVPWNPGGTNDLMARAMQPAFKELYNVDLVVKNSPGGSSAVGITEVLTSKNDGYTVGLASSSFLILVAQGRMEADLASVENLSLVAAEPVVIVAKAGGKYENAQQFLEAAKASSGQVSIGIPGANTVNQAYSVLLGQAAEAQFNFVPFDGGSRVIADVIGGHIDAGALKPSEVINQVRSGELVVLGICSKEPLSALPEAPTFASMGYDLFTLGDITQASYVMAPAGLDPQVKDKLAEMFQAAIHSENFQTFASESGMVPDPITGSELDTYLNNVFAGLQNASREIFTD